MSNILNKFLMASAIAGGVSVFAGFLAGGIFYISGVNASIEANRVE